MVTLTLLWLLAMDIIIDHNDRWCIRQSLLILSSLSYANFYDNEYKLHNVLAKSISLSTIPSIDCNKITILRFNRYQPFFIFSISDCNSCLRRNFSNSSSNDDFSSCDCVAVACIIHCIICIRINVSRQYESRVK
ncbi:hypothetical protein DERP_014854 [Dermatophagoides pteronyssinus]|uniref:Uncharacterized protein n=1 Tax=Dermatophagoides pteronyssinus TaxID=6956 RepID=A0ABQ8J4T2_DERPT|nr:hypothetical protein DERP_014854 [Dermatophagoides pteronyssinus]